MSAATNVHSNRRTRIHGPRGAEQSRIYAWDGPEALVHVPAAITGPRGTTPPPTTLARDSHWPGRSAIPSRLPPTEFTNAIARKFTQNTHPEHQAPSLKPRGGHHGLPMLKNHRAASPGGEDAEPQKPRRTQKPRRIDFRVVRAVRGEKTSTPPGKAKRGRLSVGSPWWPSLGLGGGDCCILLHKPSATRLPHRPIPC
jgi:hypothetical protein